MNLGRIIARDRRPLRLVTADGEVFGDVRARWQVIQGG